MEAPQLFVEARRHSIINGDSKRNSGQFSDGGDYDDIDAAVRHGLRLAEDGADIIDVGGESTRPGAQPVSLDEELDRTIPIIEKLCSRTRVPISIDTTKAEVARQAVAVGAQIINDISGCTFDPDMLSVCASGEAGLCLMHILGTPQTMQDEPHYQDVYTEVSQFLTDRVSAAASAGVDRQRICLDPGIGFGKTAEHNLILLQSVQRLRDESQMPLLIGHSRKRFLSHILGRAVEERLSGTIGVSIALAAQGVDILRVHDVRSVRDSLISWQAVLPQRKELR